MARAADLYLGRMDLRKYCGEDTCELCKVGSFEEFLGRLQEGRVQAGSCPHWPAWRVEAFRLAVRAGEVLPSTPMLDAPRPTATGLVELLETDETSPVLVTGNSEFSEAVMLALLSMTSTPMKLLKVDTLGHTVDMAMIFKSLTAGKIAAALEPLRIKPDRVSTRVILPGLASVLAGELELLIGRPVEIGPVCAAELPLYMGEDWQPLGGGAAEEA
ncbi:MAG TPA: hypothetical protein VM658_06535 [bacterium]|nr:hypothetical protein [bacterium]